MRHEITLKFVAPLSFSQGAAYLSLVSILPSVSCRPYDTQTSIVP